jgi:hypothetical protein
MLVYKDPKKQSFFQKKFRNFEESLFLKKIFLWILSRDFMQKKHLSLHLLCLCYFLKRVKICKVVKGLIEVNFSFFFTLEVETIFYNFLPLEPYLKIFFRSKEGSYLSE